MEYIILFHLGQGQLLANEVLKLSDSDAQRWVVTHPKCTPAQLAKVYGIDYSLLINILDSWIDNSIDKGIQNLAAEILIQHAVKARRNDQEFNLLSLCKAMEKLRDNLFDIKNPGIALRANRILGNAIDEFAQRKIQFNFLIDKSVIEKVLKIAELDGQEIIDITPEAARDGAERQNRPLLSCHSDSGLYENDGQGICSAQET